MRGDRDQIKALAESDFRNLYMDHGGRCRGRALHCIFHKDRNPSAAIRNGRFRCFTCNLSLDVFDFIAKAQATDFRGALTFLADRYAVRLNSRVLTSAQKRDYAKDRRIREEAPYFADAATLLAEWALEDLSPADPELAALRMSPEAEYRSWLRTNPRTAAALVHDGRRRTGRLHVALSLDRRGYAGGGGTC
jgi:hypothetical protein